MSEANAPNEPPPPQEPPTVQSQVTITTLPFALTPKEYTRILLRKALWNNWYHITLLTVIFLALLGVNKYDDDGNFRSIAILGPAICIFVALLWFLYYWFGCRRDAHRPSNIAAMKPRVLILKKDRITVNELQGGGFIICNTSISQDTYSHTMAADNIFFVEKYKDYYLIWMTEHSMQYLPKTAFSTPEDLKTFESIILPAYKKRKRSNY